MIRIKLHGQQRLVPESKLGYWLGLGFEVVDEQPREVPEEADDKEALMQMLDELGVEYDKRLGVKKLQAILEGAI